MQPNLKKSATVSECAAVRREKVRVRVRGIVCMLVRESVCVCVCVFERESVCVCERSFQT